MSIFLKPARISDRIADFFEVEHGTEMTVSKIWAGIEDYITEHNLMDKTRQGLYYDEKIKTLIEDSITEHKLMDKKRQGFYYDEDFQIVIDYDYKCVVGGWISLIQLCSYLDSPFYTDNNSYKYECECINDGWYYREVATGRITNIPPEPRMSGFTAPWVISDEMANFLGVDHGTEMARTDVSKQIHRYVEKHNLKNENNGRYFNADDTLAKLLNYHYKGDDKKLKLGYFNLQRYMKHHFLSRAVDVLYIYDVHTKTEQCI